MISPLAKADSSEVGLRLSSGGSTSANLNIARLNTAKLIALLYLQDIFWLLASRIQIESTGGFYKVSTFEPIVFTSFVVLAVLFALVGVSTAYFARPFTKVHVPIWFIYSIVGFSIAVNLLMLLILQDNARYSEGGLTGISGVIYGVGRAATLCSMILFIRHKASDRPLKSRLMLYGLILSFIATVDGLSNVLMLMVFILLLLPRLRILNLKVIVVCAILGVILLWVGINSKWSTIPDYVTPGYMVGWTVARFAIQAEHMFTFISGHSIVGDTVSYTDLILRSISDRVDIVLGKSLQLSYPRSVSEAMFYDARGFYGAGSSPGILLGTTLQGPFFFIVPAIYAFLFLQLFYGMNIRINFIQICAFSFLLKGIHANFSEFLTIVSPTLVTLAFYLFGCLLFRSGASFGFSGR